MSLSSPTGAPASTAAAPTGPAQARSPRGGRGTARRLTPGLLAALGAAVLAQLLTAPLPTVSPLLLAILAGMLGANTRGVPVTWEPGLGVAAKQLLRAGIVLLGLSLVLGDVLALGPGVLAAVVVVVGGGIAGTLVLGRWLRVPRQLRLLIACGFSICGAAAVAAAAGVTDPEDEHEDATVTALALVVLCGTATMLLLPLAARGLDLGTEVAGMWAGGAIHEVAQVVAAGGLIGGGALALAVVVKLARVLMLAPVMAGLSWQRRHELRDRGEQGSAGSLPPLVPGFVLGFLTMMLLASLLPLPGTVLEAAGLLRTTLLGAAMFALGCGVRWRALRRLGWRPLVLAVLATLLVSTLALGGILLAV